MSTTSQQLHTVPGLTDDQKTLYFTLLEHGLMLGKNLVLKSGLKKGLVYKVLEQLLDLGLIEKKDRGNQAALFFPAHPRNLQQFVDKQKEAATAAQAHLDEAMQVMTSKYNLLAGKPNVQMYEGYEGVRKVAFDTLLTQDTIHAYIDGESVLEYLPDLRETYNKRRLAANIPMNILMPDTSYTRQIIQGNTSEITNIRTMKDWSSFATILYLYNNKVAYLTLEPKRLIGFVIEDTTIYNMHISLFKNHWKYGSIT